MRLEQDEDFKKYRMFPDWMEPENIERVWRGQLPPVSQVAVSHLYYDDTVGNYWLLFRRQIHQHRVEYTKDLCVDSVYVHCSLC